LGVGETASVALPPGACDPLKMPRKEKFFRSKTDRILGGVCGGMADYLGLDPLLVRVLWVLSLTFGVGLVAYILLWLLAPEE
jgi:phage shock protein C